MDSCSDDSITVPTAATPLTKQMMWLTGSILCTYDDSVGMIDKSWNLCDFEMLHTDLEGGMTLSWKEGNVNKESDVNAIYLRPIGDKSCHRQWRFAMKIATLYHDLEENLFETSMNVNIMALANKEPIILCSVDSFYHSFASTLFKEYYAQNNMKAKLISFIDRNSETSQVDQVEAFVKNYFPGLESNPKIKTFLTTQLKNQRPKKIKKETNQKHEL